jgi:hypothetical protein
VGVQEVEAARDVQCNPVPVAIPQQVAMNVGLDCTAQVTACRSLSGCRSTPVVIGCFKPPLGRGTAELIRHSAKGKTPNYAPISAASASGQDSTNSAHLPCIL